MSSIPISPDASSTDEPPFLTDVKTLREQARQHIVDGAVARTEEGDTQTAVRVLNAALATELVCVLRYKRHYFMAQGIRCGPLATEFLELAGEEQGHADRIAERIVQLGGEPDLAPDDLVSHRQSEYAEGRTLIDLIKEDVFAEKITIDGYREMIVYFSTFDPTTREMLEEITATEEEHVDDLADLLRSLPQVLTN